MVNAFLEEKFGLKKRVALVIGGGGGLGRSISIGLAKAGASVVIADINTSAAYKVSKEILALNKKSMSIAVDITNSKSVIEMVQEVLSKYTNIDILVNSVGITIHKPAQEMTDDDWNKVIRINLDGTFFSCRAVGSQMIKQKKGSIINIASMSGTITNKDSYNAPYCASKGGVKMLTKQLAEQWARYNIRVNSISPGIMNTELTKKIIEKPEYKKYIEINSPMKRAGMPDELMGLAIYMASDASSFLTGEDIIIDGGWSIV